MIVLATERFHPFCGGDMLLRPRGTRHLSVADLTDEDVPERELGLARNGRAPLLTDESLAHECVQRVGQRVLVETGQRGDAAGPEDLAEDCRVLEQALLV